MAPARRPLAEVNRLAVENVRLVYKIARFYRYLGLEYDDLVQNGFFGLRRAAERFDPSRGFAFSTYASYWIRQAITRGLQEQGRNVRRPTHRWQSAGIPPRELSLNTKRRFETGDGGEIEWQEILRAREGDDPNVVVEADEDREIARRRAYAALRALTPREREVIRRRYLQDPPDKLVDIGRDIGVTRERVRQIQAKALRLMRAALEKTR